MLSAFITPAHRARSVATNLSISAWLFGRSGGKPTLSSEARNASSFRALFEAGGDFLRDVVGQFGRRGDAVPDADAILRIAALGHGRDIGQIGDALRRADRERPQQAALDRRQRGAERVEHQLDIARYQIGQRRACALVGDVDHVDAGHLLEHLAGQMNGAAGAGRSEIEFSRVLLGVGHELRHRLGGHGGMHLHDDGQVRDQRQQAEIPDRIIGQLFVEQRVEHEDRSRREEQRVAIGLRARRRLGADRALRAGLVLDHDGLLQVTAEIFADHAAEHVGRTARGIGHDQLDRARRIFRRVGVRRGPDETAGQRR